MNPTSPPHIRPAGADDAEAIYRFICELAVYEKEPNAVLTTPGEIKAQLLSEPPPFDCLLAELDGTAVGFALFFTNYSTWKGRQGVHLEDLYVEPSYRNLGLGKALFCAVAAVARERGCPRMEWAALNWNTPAIEFYENLGAEALREWTTFRLSGEALANAGKTVR